MGRHAWTSKPGDWWLFAPSPQDLAHAKRQARASGRAASFRKVTCPKCGEELGANVLAYHLDSAFCRSLQHVNKLLANGYVRVSRQPPPEIAPWAHRARAKLKYVYALPYWCSIIQNSLTYQYRYQPVRKLFGEIVQLLATHTECRTLVEKLAPPSHTVSPQFLFSLHEYPLIYQLMLEDARGFGARSFARWLTGCVKILTTRQDLRTEERLALANSAQVCHTMLEVKKQHSAKSRNRYRYTTKQFKTVLKLIGGNDVLQAYMESRNAMPVEQADGDTQEHCRDMCSGDRMDHRVLVHATG